MRNHQIANKQIVRVQAETKTATVVALDGRTAVLKTMSGDRFTARFAVFSHAEGEPNIGDTYTVELVSSSQAVSKARKV